jgi:soluble lytic murein transglycosylase-like protein
MSNYRLETSVLNIDFYVKNSNELRSTGTVKTQKNKNIDDSFYSLIIKHQLEMARAWNPSGENSGFNMDPFSLSKSLLQVKGFSNDVKLKPTFNTQKILNSYETSKINEDSNNLNKSSLQALSAQVAINNSVPPTLFQKLIQIESGYDAKALSPRGAIGLGQIMPETAKELGLSLDTKETRGSVWHAESNLDASARYLRKLYTKYQKEGISKDEAWNFAAGAYNAGMGNIAKAINKISQEPVKTWDQVAKELPKVTGKYSQETIRYVDRLRA